MSTSTNRPMWGLLNFSKLLKAANQGHPAFQRGAESNDIFVNVSMWTNESPDQYGNVASLQINPPKDVASDDKEARFYFANFKPAKKPTPLQPGDLNIPTDGDMPF